MGYYGRISRFVSYALMAACCVAVVMLIVTAVRHERASPAVGQVLEVARAPDGTVLWQTRAPSGDVVFFSARGTEHEECTTNGKTEMCRKIQVPNAE